MASGSKKQIYFISGAILLTVGIYLLPIKKGGKDEEVKKESSTPVSSGFEQALKQAKTQMDSTSLNILNKLESQLKSDDKSGNVLLDSIGKTWDRFKQPAISAHYFEIIAKNDSTENNWLNAAYRYFDAFKMSRDSVKRSMLVNKAIETYTKVLAINAKNLDAKTDLGVCYTESPQPMKGIMMLREVVTEKPDHENAQLNLGFLSVRSRQFDKAVERFNKVLEINPKNIDVYLYLGEAYLQKGDKNKAIESFEKYKSETKDPSAIKEVDEYVKRIRNN